MSSESMRALRDPFFDHNPIAVQMLGICSALAVTTRLQTALVMSIAVTAVLVFSNLGVSLLRNAIPSSIRIVVELTIIASLVIVTDQILKAYAYSISRQLSIFVGLIITNCMILGRAETFAMRNGPAMSVLDGVGNGVGYALVLLLVAACRELFGTGRLFGSSVLLTVEEGGFFVPNGLMLLSPAAFFLIGLLVWALRTFRPALIDEPLSGYRPDRAHAPMPRPEAP